MKKVLVVLLLLALNILPISAYEVPENNLFLHVEDSNLGNIKIYLPVTQNITFSTRANTDVINIGSSNVTGYFEYNGTDYSVTFQPYQLGRYRLSNNYEYEYLDIIQIYDTNLSFYEDDNSYFLQNFEIVSIILSIVEVFSLWMLLFFRR